MNTKLLAGILFVLLVAPVWYFAFLPGKNQTTTGQKEFTLRVVGKKLVEGPAVLSATQGDRVSIHITSDVAEELHLHGYDRSVDLEPGKESTLTFTADMSGRFRYELEKSKTELGALEVQPR